MPMSQPFEKAIIEVCIPPLNIFGSDWRKMVRCRKQWAFSISWPHSPGAVSVSAWAFLVATDELLILPNWSPLLTTDAVLFFSNRESTC